MARPKKTVDPMHELKLGLVCITHASPVRLKEGRVLMKPDPEESSPEAWMVLDWDAVECIDAWMAGKTSKPCRIWACVDVPEPGMGPKRHIWKDPKGEPRSA